jgi:methyl-accepting chemotaxis protein
VTSKSTDEAGLLAQSFRNMIGTINELMSETGNLVAAAKQGELNQRGDLSKFDGAYRQLVQGVNETLDAVVEPIKEASAVLEKVAARDLSPRVQGNYQGDHAQIKNALNSALDNLEEALTQVSVGAEQVTSAATQISNGSQSLAQGASEQASSLEEVSSSLEEMSSMTKQNADNSNQGKLLAGEAQDAAERGNEAMQRMGGAITKIKESSDATAKIVKTIDEIAFQTNLLALNAAVEAARAGEAGKGFAVVAEEVRNLAQRSAEAAKNTANMIEESVKNAEGGVRITEEVAKALAEIAEGNRKVNDLVAEIAAASGEQSKGIDQINLAVQQLDKVTQQTAANSEESASAAEELNSQATTLADTVSQFTLSSQNGRKRAAQRPKEPSSRNGSRPAPAREQSAPERELVGAGASRNGQSRVSKASLMIPLDDEDFKGF